MSSDLLRRVARGTAVALVAVVAAGCSSKLRTTLLPNQPPEVRLTAAPLSSQDRYFYAISLNWVGYDPDGRVEHFLYAVDPPSVDVVDSTWVRTTKNEITLFFSSTEPDPIKPGLVTASSPHVFAIYAVDNLGQRSLVPAHRAFFSFTMAPQVQILSPRPTPLLDPMVTPTVRITWRGVDLDGQFTQKPVRYVYRLFSARNPDFPGIPNFISFALLRPDSLRKLYAPAFAGWDTSGAEKTDIQYRDLVPQSSYLFVVTGFDEAGAYDPVFSATSNMLRLSVTFAGTFGPVITMFNEFFNYTYPLGGYASDATRYFRVEVPADQVITFNWFAEPPEGADIRRYRWVIDLQDLDDETPRSNETTDWYRWSAYSRNTTSARIGPFTTHNEEHLFYIEAEDNNGLRSLGIINFLVVRATFEHELLFVDDARLVVDQLVGGTGFQVAPPTGRWPTAAELDSFFFARGGFPWHSYPAGTLSRPGVFSGYEFDTLGTRGLPNGIVPLSRLGRYKHVVWYTDAGGASMNAAPTDLRSPITSLRLVASPGQPTTLSTYMRQGGKVWLMGGGAAYATLIAYNRRGTPTWIYSERDGELVPGRMMYDFVHWRSEVAMGSVASAVRTSQRNGVPGRGWLGQPDYSKLPQNLQPRTLATDPPPPLRVGNSNWLVTLYDGEVITRPNFIREDLDPRPDFAREESTLDTLYTSVGGVMPFDSPVMTYYHGLENPALDSERASMVFSGFPLWFFRRSQCIALADFVLQDIWGLPRAPVSRSVAPVASRAARSDR